MHLPVLNSSETVFSVRRSIAPSSDPSCSVCLGAEVASPAQVLPVANWSTVADRWNAWSAVTSTGIGSRLAFGNLPLLTDARDALQWPTLLFTRDNLGVNDCIVASEEQKLDAAVAAGVDVAIETTLLSTGCCTHSAVLGMKPVFQSLGDVPGTLVRLGHLLESGRNAGNYYQAVMDEIESDFHYDEVAIMPPEAAAWHSAARKVLEMSRPALNLTPEDEEAILAADNGNWAEKTVRHLCLNAGRCPLKCNGSRVRSLANVKPRVALSICGRLEIALTYRWKGFEKANAWCYRGRKQHDLLLRGLKRLWKPKAIRDAEEQAALLGPENVPDNIKRTVRAASVITNFSKNLGGVENEVACLLNAPLQHFLNESLAAEKATTKFAELASLNSTEAVVEPPEMIAARSDAKKRNLSIILGRKGDAAVNEAFAMLTSYSTGAWAEISSPRQRKHDLACSLVRLIAEAWWRLVFYYKQQPKFEVFAACAQDHPDQALAAQVCTPLEQRGAACPMCVDRFAAVWGRRCLSSSPTLL